MQVTQRAKRSKFATEKYTGPITIIGDEPHLPYQRPPLSKAYLSGSQEVERVYLGGKILSGQRHRPETSTRATAIDPDAKVVELADGSSIDYDKLLISTGSRPRILNIPGSDLGGIHYLRTIDDVDGIRAEMREGANLVIVGGGYIGLEVAAVGVEQGLNVHVLEMEERILQRVTTPTMSKYYDELHRGRGSTSIPIRASPASAVTARYKKYYAETLNSLQIWSSSASASCQISNWLKQRD